MTQDDFTSGLERAVLGALDRYMNQLVHGSEVPRTYMIGDIRIDPEDVGWRDADLSLFLPAIRRHAAALWERYDLTKAKAV